MTVTATDSKFTLSKRSAPTGTVIFAVTNKGKISHDFKIAGKKTPLLLPGRSATLRVTFSKRGRYPYLSTVSGQAAHGMKGVFSVVAARRAHARPDRHAHHHNRPDRRRRSVRPTRRSRSTCSTPTRPRHFVLSQTTIPSGMVTFVITNKCVDAMQLRPRGHQGGRDTQPRASRRRGRSRWPRASTATTATWTHVMKGSFTVTP